MNNCGNITKPKTRVYNHLAKLDLLKELPQTISDQTVFFPRHFLLNNKKTPLYTTPEGNLVFEPGKKTPLTWETVVNKELIDSVSKIYGMVLPADTKIVEFVYPAEGKTKYIDAYVKLNDDILTRIERFAYEYPQELVPPQMEESNKLEPDDFTEKESPSPSPSPTLKIDEKGQYRMFSKIGEEETQILTEDMAKDLFNFLFEKTGLSGEVINDKSQKFKGAVVGGVPTINVAYAELSDGFHEYLHPVMMSLRISNPQLFNKLYEDLKKLPQWKEISDRALKRVQKFYPELKNVNDFKEEVMVTALGYAAELKSNKQLETVKANRPFFDWANNFYKWLTEFLNGLFTNTVDLSKVGLDTTLENLVEWITDTKTKILLTEDWQNLANMSQEIDNSLEITEADNLNTLENSLLSGLDRKDKTQTLEDYISDWVKTKFKSKVRPYKPKKYDQESFVYQEAKRLINIVGNSGYEFSKEEIKSLPEKTYQELAQVIDQLDLNFRFSSWLMSKGKTPIALNSPFKPDNTPAAELKAVEIFRKELQDKYPNRKSLPADELAEEYTAWAKENYGLSVTDAVGHVGYGLNRLLISTAIDSNYTRKLFLDNYIVKSGHSFNIGKNITGNGLGWYASVEVNNDGFDHEFQSDILPEISKSYKKDQYKSTAYQLTEASSEDLARRVAFQKVFKQIDFSLDSKFIDVLDHKTFEFTRPIDEVQKFLISEIDVQVDSAKVYGVVPDYLVDFKIISKIINTLKAPKSENYKQLEDWIKKYVVIEEVSKTSKITETTDTYYDEGQYLDLPFSKEPERQFIMEYSTGVNENIKNFKYYALSEGFDNLPDFIQIEIDRHNAWHNSKDPLRPILPTYSRGILAAFAPGRGTIPIQKIYPPGATKLKNYWQTRKSLENSKITTDHRIEKIFNKYRKAKKIIKGAEFRKKLYEDQENIIRIKNYWKDQYERYLNFFTKEYEFVKQEAQNQISEKNTENREVFYEKYVDIYKKWFDITIQHSINTRKLQGKTYYYLPTAEAMKAIEGNTIAAPLYRTTFEVDKEKQTVKDYLVKYIQQNTQETTDEIKKYWSQISNFVNQESTVSDIADALMGNTDFVDESNAFKGFVAEQDAWYKVSKPTVGPFYSALSKFAKKNNIKLSYETPDWSITPLIKVDISEYDYKPIDRFSKLETTPIKPGVQELFESNPELANAVYEALGFETIDVGWEKGKTLYDKAKPVKIDFKSGITTLSNGNYLVRAYRTDDTGLGSKGYGQRGEGLYLSLTNPYPGRDINTVEFEVSPSDIVTYKKEFSGTIPYEKLTEGKGNFQDRVALAGGKAFIGGINSSEDPNLEIVLYDKTLIDKALASKKKVSNFTTKYLLYDLITPQQKQQAQQLYSQYLDTIFPDSKVKDILYHGTDAEFDKFSKDIKKILNREISNTAIAYFFTNDLNRIKNYGKNKINALINSKELLSFKNISNDRARVLSNITYERAKSYTDRDIDSIVADYDLYKDYIVFEPEQIHILGNQEDIEGFKEFVSGETTKEEAPPFYEMSAEEREERFQDFYKENQNISEEEAREYFNRCMI